MGRSNGWARPPKWMGDEETIRRVLMLRKAGKTRAQICEESGVTQSQIDRVLWTARQGRFPGERMVCMAFRERWDEAGDRPKPDEPMFTEEDGELIAEDILRWILPEPLPPGDG